MAKKHISKINLMDIVIQGPYTSFTDKILETYLPLEFINKIIVSCWEGDRDYSILPESVQKDADRVKFVKSPQYEGYAGPANVNLQLTTCRAGVQETEAAYVAKFRSDQLYTQDSLRQMWNFWNSYAQTEKIFILGDFFTHVFHPRDWVYWGYRETMIDLFDIPDEKNFIAQGMGINSGNYGQYMNMVMRPEAYIGAHYCARFDDRVVEMLDKPQWYLYDGAPRWDEAKKVSDEVMRKAFKSFSRKGIDMGWPRNDIYCFPQDPNYEKWHEEGF